MRSSGMLLIIVECKKHPYNNLFLTYPLCQFTKLLEWRSRVNIPPFFHFPLLQAFHFFSSLLSCAIRKFTNNALPSGCNSLYGSCPPRFVFVMVCLLCSQTINFDAFVPNREWNFSVDFSTQKVHVVCVSSYSLNCETRFPQGFDNGPLPFSKETILLASICVPELPSLCSLLAKMFVLWLFSFFFANLGP